MLYYIINKLEKINNEVITSNVGYVTNQTDADTFNSIHRSDYYNWITTNLVDLENGNLEMINYFDSNTHVYLQTMCMSVLPNVPLITDLINIE